MENKLRCIFAEIQKLQKEKDVLLIAIDGRCAAGKTTLARKISEQTDCNIIHMDHFFLRPEQRTEERYMEAGGNIDRERLIEQVMLPLSRREAFDYRPYNCRRQQLDEVIHINPKAINIIEGSYACHPSLRGFYDLTIFLTVDKAGQLRRISDRNGESQVPIFRDKWIVLEEKYFSAYQVQENCDIWFET